MRIKGGQSGQPVGPVTEEETSGQIINGVLTSTLELIAAWDSCGSLCRSSGD